VQGTPPFVAHFLRVGHQQEKRKILNWDDADERSVQVRALILCDDSLDVVLGVHTVRAQTHANRVATCASMFALNLCLPYPRSLHHAATLAVYERWTTRFAR
jgi:hypothetical protein